jgi:hypothetical protein
MTLAFARMHGMLHALEILNAGEPPNPLGASIPDANAWAAGASAAAKATAMPIGNPGYDILAWYSHELAAGGAVVDSADARLVSLFSIMLGLGMRESSGAHCVGADSPKSRGEPTTEENAEAGVFQVSHDSIGADADRQALFDAFRRRTDLLSVFSEHISCKAKDLKNHGVGAGAEFQKTMKECPLFAVLYTSLFLRQQRSHWGPINTRAAEVRGDAVAHFRAAQRALETHA